MARIIRQELIVKCKGCGANVKTDVFMSKGEYDARKFGKSAVNCPIKTCNLMFVYDQSEFLWPHVD